MNFNFMKKTDIPYKFKTVDPQHFVVLFTYEDHTGDTIRKHWQEAVKMFKERGQKKLNEEPKSIIIPPHMLNMFTYVLKDPMKQIKSSVARKGINLTYFKVAYAQLIKEVRGFKVVISVEGDYNNGLA